MKADDLILLTKSLRELGVAEFSHEDFQVKFRSDLQAPQPEQKPSLLSQVEADRDRTKREQAEQDEELALSFASAGR